jgi:hypothetical protein
MKISIDFSSIKKGADFIKAPEREYSIVKTEMTDLDKIRIELEKGIEVEIDEVQPNSGGLLAYKGLHVLLYIMDHGNFISKTLRDPKNGNRFHVADCSTLEMMRREKRFERYVATNNISGVFKITGKRSFWGGGDIEGNAKLHVCQNCLRKLNYEKFRSLTQEKKYPLVTKFDLSKFFSTYSSYFSQSPSHTEDDFPGSSYSLDWKQVSAAYREGKGWTCEKCDVNLSQHRNLLHAHHINGIKADNRPENLKALCIDCHSKEPKHAMYVSRKDRQLINKLRNKSKENIPESWREVFELADPAVHGLLDLCQRKGMDIPEVGYDISDSYCEVIDQVELAWPRSKKAISIGCENGIEKMKGLGWIILEVDQAILEWFG